MKIISAFLLLLFAITGNAQREILKKGNSVYIEAPASEHAGDVKQELTKQVSNWGYWRIASSKKSAQFIMRLNVKTHRGMTAWSWGGITVRASVSLLDKNGEVLWESNEYKANPNGTNGFNTSKATISKIVNKDLKREFKK